MTDYDLYSLGHREFEHLIQSLSTKIIATGITPFGDGPDGGREATYEGKMKYPTDKEPWNGYLVIQCKHRTRGASPSQGADGNWALNQLEKELKKFTDSKRKLRIPDFYLFATNVSLSAAFLTGAKDRINNLLRKYSQLLYIKSFDIWSYDEICRFLDSNMDIRSHYAHFLSSGDLLIEVRTELESLKASQQDVAQNLKQLEKERRDLQNRLDKLTSSSMRFAASFSTMPKFKPAEDKRISELTDNVRSFVNEITNIIGNEHPDVILSRATVSSANMDYHSVLELIPSGLAEKLLENAELSIGHAIEVYRLRAAAFFKLRRWAEAISEYNLLIKLDQNADYAKRNIGVALLELGSVGAAKKLFLNENNRLKYICEHNPNLDDVLNLVSNYGYSALANRHIGDINAAISDSKKAIALIEVIKGDIPAGEFNSYLAHIHNTMGLVYRENGKASIALTHNKKSISFFKKVLENNKSEISDDHHNLAYAVSLSNCADSYLTIGDTNNALHYYNLADNECAKIVNQIRIGGAIDELANILTNRSAVYSEVDKKYSIKDLNYAHIIRQKLVKAGYFDREGYLAITLLNRGKKLYLYGKNNHALRDMDKAIGILEKTAEKNGKIKFVIFYILALTERSIVYVGINENDFALQDLDAAIRIYFGYKDVLMPNILRLVSANAFYLRGNLKEILKFKIGEIIDDFTNCIRILQILIDNNCDDLQAYSLLCNCLIRRGDNILECSLNRAEADYCRSISIAENFIKSNGDMPQITLSLVWGLYSRKNIYTKMEETTKATSDLFRAATLAKKVYESKEMQNNESLIGNILADYSSTLIESGRSQEVYIECNYFLDYLKAKREKVNKLSHAKIYNNVGHALTLNGKPNDAIEMYDLAIEIYNTHEEKEKSEYLLSGSINNRGNAKYTSGNFDSALKDYDFSIEIAKSLYSKNQSDDNKFLFARSLVSKAWLLSTCPDISYRDPDNALILSKIACEYMKWCDIDCLYTYAAACAENNNFIKACSWQRKAISMSSNGSEKAFLEMILFYYENKKPYRAQTV